MSANYNKGNKKVGFSKGHPHDLFFRRFFSGIEEVVALLETMLPQPVFDLLDISTVKIENSVVVKDLEIRVDLVLSIKLRKSKRRI